MALAMEMAVEAGQFGFEAGRILRKATASSPLEGLSVK
jgi:thiazole synthase